MKPCELAVIRHERRGEKIQLDLSCASDPILNKVASNDNDGVPSRERWELTQQAYFYSVSHNVLVFD